MAGKNEKRKYTFLEPGDMPRAKAAILFSLISLLILLATLLIARIFKGKAGLALGAAALVGALCAGYAFIIGLKALSRRESRHRLCVTAAISSGLMAIIWLTIFLSGLQ